MRKTTIVCSVVATLALVLAVGCATGGKGPSDEELISALLTTWEAGIMEKNVDKLLTTFSDDFSHSGMDFSADGKEELQQFVEDSIAMGYLDGVDISYDPSAIVVEGDTATIYPLYYSNTQGDVTVSMTAKKSAGAWLLTDMAIEGL
jgi:ketosteroid isomerase-like protein